MAGESQQEKTEQPTQHRRDEAKKEGRVASSREFNSAIALLASALLLGAVGPDLGLGVRDLLVRSADWWVAREMRLEDAVTMLQEVVRESLSLLVPICFGMVGIGVFSSLLQTRGVMSLNAIQPKLSHINPIQGFGRIFSWKSVIAVVTQVVRISIVTLVAYLLIRSAWGRILASLGQDPGMLLSEMRILPLRLLGFLGLAYLIIAAIDYSFRWWELEKSLRMTHQEIKDEAKNTDGDPLIKMRIRQLMRNMARSRMMNEVPKADVVIVNPTHRAVALRYRLGEDAVPVIVAMGERKTAERIRALAQEHGVPIVENRPLAIALIKTGAVGEPVPMDLFDAVATVLIYVFERRYGASALRDMLRKM